MKVDQNPASIFLKLADENLKIYFHWPSSCFLFFQIYEFFDRKYIYIYICMQKKKSGRKRKRRKEKRKSWLRRELNWERCATEATAWRRDRELHLETGNQY